MQVQIGCQTDDIGKAAVLKRAPVVYERFHIDSEKMEVFSLWGGLIYLVAPTESEEGELEIVVQNAIPAPYYKSGESQTPFTEVLSDILCRPTSLLGIYCPVISHFNPW